MDRGEQRNKKKWKFKERKKHPYRRGGKFRASEEIKDAGSEIKNEG